MAIQPIDLQTLYTQMDKVAKNVVQQQQGVQLQSAMQIEGQVKKTMEQSSSVQKLKDEENLTAIRDEKKNNENSQSGKNRRHSHEEPEDEEVIEVIKDPLLGQNIDISG